MTCAAWSYNASLMQQAATGRAAWMGGSLQELVDAANDVSKESLSHGLEAKAQRLVKEQASFVAWVEEELQALSHVFEEHRVFHTTFQQQLDSHGKAWRQEAASLTEGLAKVQTQLAQTMEAALWSGKEIGAVRQDISNNMRSQIQGEPSAQVGSRKLRLPPPPESLPESHGSSREQPLVAEIAQRLAAVEERVEVCNENMLQTGDFFAQAVVEVTRSVAQLSRGLGSVESSVLAMEAPAETARGIQETKSARNTLDAAGAFPTPAEITAAAAAAVVAKAAAELQQREELWSGRHGEHRGITDKNLVNSKGRPPVAIEENSVFAPRAESPASRDTHSGNSGGLSSLHSQVTYAVMETWPRLKERSLRAGVLADSLSLPHSFSFART